MRRLLLFLVLAISQSWLVAQAPNLTTTNGEPNGVWWNTNVNSSEKVTFAIGFSIGVAVAGTQV
jgi:hypothetical protein